MIREVKIAGTWREVEWRLKKKVTKEDADKRLTTLIKQFAQSCREEVRNV